MADNDSCGNCGETITDGGVFKSANARIEPQWIQLLNVADGKEYTDLCEKCGRKDLSNTYERLQAEQARFQKYVTDNIIDFPMMTLSQVPPGAECKIKSMVTSNVSVGTGLFNEFSQGFSDMFGKTNSETGMALKANAGETAARSILVMKAIALGANCIIAVDIDYGTTSNNSATVNMQGTAVQIDNLQDILCPTMIAKYQKLEATRERASQIARWLKGDFQ